MRICYLANASSPHMEKLVRFFTDNGHDVHIISFERPRISMDGVTVHHVPTRKKLIIPFTFHKKIKQFKKIIHEISPDIVHAHYITKYGILTPYLGFQPCVLSAWGSDVLLAHKTKILNRLYRFFAKKAVRGADGLHIDGIRTKQALIELGSTEDKILLAHFGVAVDQFSPEMRSDEVRHNLRIDGKIAVISSRSFYPIYDVKSLIIAAQLVLSENPNIRFILLGDGPLRQDLEELTEKLGLSEFISFKGHLQQKIIATYLASSDIYVSTALSDTFAVSTMEAMSCACPVVITDDIDNRLYIEDGVNGFIVPPSNSQMLAEKILLLSNDAEMRQAFGQHGRELIVERCNYVVEMQKILDWYTRIISSNF